MKRPSFSNDLEPGKNRQQLSIERQKVVELTEEKNYHFGLPTLAPPLPELSGANLDQMLLRANYNRSQRDCGKPLGRSIHLAPELLLPPGHYKMAADPLTKYLRLDEGAHKNSQTQQINPAPSPLNLTLAANTYDGQGKPPLPLNILARLPPHPHVIGISIPAHSKSIQMIWRQYSRIQAQIPAAWRRGIRILLECKYRLLHTQYLPQHEASQREILASSVIPEGYSSVAQEAAVDPLILREALIQAINILQMKTCVNIATAGAHFAICTISGSRRARPPNSIFAFQIPCGRPLVLHLFRIAPMMTAVCSSWSRKSQKNPATAISSRQPHHIGYPSPMNYYFHPLVITLLLQRACHLP